MLNITVGQPFSASYVALDADGHPITLNMTGLPTDATFNVANGIFSWTPATLTQVPNLRYIKLAIIEATHLQLI